MSVTFDKKQIVSSTELVRSFKKYEDEVSLHDIFIFKRNCPEAVLLSYSRYEKMKNQLDELKELFEHVAIYDMAQQRKKSPVKKVCLNKLKKKYGL
ncbi:MAG: hypothetical protein ABIH08_04715 [Candidatus Omnitrophota bacterium]